MKVIIFFLCIASSYLLIASGFKYNVNYIPRHLKTSSNLPKYSVSLFHSKPLDISPALKLNSEKESEDRKKGLTCILGGALTHLTLGTIYCWGNFLSYAPDSLLFLDGKTHPGVPPDALYVLPLTFLAQTVVMPFAPMLFRTIGARKSLLLGSWISALCVYAASYQTRLLPFILFYSILYGFGLGISYTAPMFAGWKWLPKNSGLVSGGVLAGFGGGGFIFSLLGSKLVNPKGLNPINGKFPLEVYNNFPIMLRTLALAYAALAFVGSCLVSEPKAQTVSSDTSSNKPVQAKGLSVFEALSTPQFWLMWLMAISSATAGLNTVVTYKQFATTSSALTGDGFQALVGGIGAIFNGSGRLFWGNLSDIIGFKRSFILLTIFQTISMLLYKYSIVSKVFHFTFYLPTILRF